MQDARILGLPEDQNYKFCSRTKDGEELAALFSKVMGKEVRFQQLPGFITRLALGRDLTKMFRWVNNNNVLFADIEASKKEFGGLLDFETWIRKHFT